MINYHTTFNSRRDTQDCKTVQLMLSGYRCPSAHGIEKIAKSWDIPQDLIFHQDYYRTSSRYSFLTPHMQQAVIEEVAQVLLIGNQYEPNVKGIVIHTDSPFSLKAFQSFTKYFDNVPFKTEEENDTALAQVIAKHFNSKLYGSNPERLTPIFKKTIVIAKATTAEALLHGIEVGSTVQFLSDLEVFLNQQPTPVMGKVFLENTVRTLRGESFFADIENLKSVTGLFRGIAGVCFDEEHAYASGWETLINDEGKRSEMSLEGIDLVHLNTIPPNVERGSYLDRHSDTSMDESKFPKETYLSIIEELDNKAIPYIREVHEATRLAENTPKESPKL